MAPTHPSYSRFGGGRDNPFEISDDESASSEARSPRPRKTKAPVNPNENEVQWIGSRKKEHVHPTPNSLLRARLLGQGTQLAARSARFRKEIVDLTLSPEPEEVQQSASDTVMRDAAQSPQSPEKSSDEREEGALSKASTPRKRATPGKPGNARQESTPGRHADRDTPITLAIDESNATFQDIELQDEPPNCSQTPTLPVRIQFKPLPEFTFESPPPTAPKSRSFTDWKPPDTPLKYEDIQDMWQRNLDEFHEDHARFASDKLERARMHNQKAEIAYDEAHQERLVKTASTQSNPLWYEAPTINTPSGPHKAGNDAFSFTVKPCLKGAQTSRLSVTMSSFTPKAVKIPHFKTYYPIRQSQLVQSDRDLLSWPEATENDNLSEDDIKNELKGQFFFRMVTRAAEVAYVQIGRQWQPYTEAFLQELGLSEEDMLRFLIDDSYDAHIRSILQEIQPDKGEIRPLDMLKQIRRELRDAPQSRAIADRVKAITATEGNTDEINKLRELKFSYLALAFYAVSKCYRYIKNLTSFNFIYTLTQSPTLDIGKYLRDPKDERPDQPKYSAATHFDFACRICHVYPCFVHGLDSMWDYRPPDPPEDIDDEEASIEEQLCPLLDTLTNIYRRELGRRPVQAPKPSKEKPEKDPEFQNYKLYGDPNAQGKARVFFPCDHQGPCVVGTCRCANNGEGGQHLYCEKSCGCDQSCKRRFKGCRCAKKGKPCSEESKCPCLKAERECDPDLCGTCGVYEALDPQNCDKDMAFFKERCQNCQIQRNVPKRTLIGESTVHGIGLFAGEDIKKGEYIGEYLGAKLNWKQAERSGLYLLLNGYSYLFDMTGDQTVDAMVLGNKIRFINSIVDKLNCTPKVMMCNTEHRMGLYATKDITAGEELSFNYGDNFFHNHSAQSKRKQEKEKAVGVKYKRGPYKKKAKQDKGKAPAMRKSIPAAVRSKDAEVIQQIVDVLQREEPEPGIELDVDVGMQLDEDDSGDEDYEDEGYEEDDILLMVEESDRDEDEDVVSDR